MNIWKYVRKEWKINSIVLLIDVISSSCLTLNGLALANILTEIVQSDLSAVFIWVLVLGGVSILWSAEIFMHKRCFTIAMQKMDADIRKDITIYLVDSGYTTFHKNNPSVYVSWLTNDINTINEYGFECLEMAIAQAITIVMSIATIISFHYSLIITILVLFVIMYFVPKLFSKVTNRASLKASKAAETATRKISDFLAGFDDLLVMNLKKHIVEAINQSSSILKKAKVRQGTAIGSMMGASNLSSTLSQTIVIGQACFLYVIKAIPVGGISGASYFAGNIFALATGMLANFMEVKTTVPVFEKYVSFSEENNLKPQNSRNLDKLDKQNPEIIFDSVDFSYDANPVLKECSFKFIAYKKYLLTGDSGTGKTTILDLIAMKNVPQKGSIFFDYTNYADIAAADIYEQLMYIKQKPHIFNETLEFNITLGQPIPREEIEHAVNVSGLGSLIAQLPGGLKTQIAENGEKLSGGQVQRIALARGLVQKKRIWLVDEATSSLDPASRQDIEDRLMSLKNITMIMVSHNATERLRKQVDEEIHLENKKIQTVNY